MGRALAAGATYPFTYRSELPHFAGDSRRPLTFDRADADAIEAELYSHLIPIKRRIWVQRALLLLVRTAVLAVGIQLFASIVNFAGIQLRSEVWQGISALVGLLAVILILQQRVSFADAARVLDRRLGLQQVIGTAVELTRLNTDGRVARLQMRRATDALRRLESREAIRVGLPIRDLRVLAIAAVLTILFTFLATLNIAWPGTPRAEDLASDPSLEMAIDAPYEPTFYEGEGGSAFDSELFGRSFDDYMMDLEGQNLTPEELAQRIAEIQAQLAQRAEAAARQRQALSDLAEALSDSSTTSDAADSIRRGDYQRAASQLGELGKQSAQLSPRARQDLARRLNEAANRVAPNNPDLANRMRRAAQQLAGSDQQAMEQALAELGEGVNQAGEQMRQLTNTGADFDPSMMDGAGVTGDFEAEGLGGLSDYEGAMGEFGEGFEDGFGEGQPMLGGLDDDGLGPPRRADGLGAQGSRGSGAGQAPGVEQYRSQDALRAQQGKLLELRGRPTDSGGSTIDEGGRVPLVASSDGTVGGAVGAAGTRSVILDPLSVRAEQNFVPWEKRQIIKDYFTGSTK